METWKTRYFCGNRILKKKGKGYTIMQDMKLVGGSKTFECIYDELFWYSPSKNRVDVTYAGQFQCSRGRSNVAANPLGSEVGFEIGIS